MGFDFSHEGVKRVVGLLKGFVHAIASAPRVFLYFSYLEINEHTMYKIKNVKNKNKNTNKKPRFSFCGVGRRFPLPLRNPSHTFNTTASGAGMSFFGFSGHSHSWLILCPSSRCKTPWPIEANFFPLICSRFLPLLPMVVTGTGTMVTDGFVL